MQQDQGNTPNMSTLPKGFKSVPKFNPGDKVNTPYGEAEILESTGTDAWGHFEYLLRNAEGAEYYDYEMNLNNDQGPAPRKSTKPACECGYQAIYGKASPAWMHSDWCPVYRKEG